MSDQEFLKRYALLNQSQKKAVDTIFGPVLVVAGPGSGKTEILSLRVANILRNTDTLPSSILCLTFTDSGALNMRKRLAGLIGPSAYRVGIYTFHSFCSMVIDSYPEIFYNGREVANVPEPVKHETLNQIFEELAFDDPLVSKFDGTFSHLKDAQKIIGELKKAVISPEQFMTILDHNLKIAEAIEPIIIEALADRVGKSTAGKIEIAREKLKALEFDDLPIKSFKPLNLAIEDAISLALDASAESGQNTPFSVLKVKLLGKDKDGTQRLKEIISHKKLLSFANVYKKYKERIFEAGYYDFDDMIADVISAIESHPSLRLDLLERFQFVLVDEFQDTNDGQMRLVTSLVDSPEYEDRPNLMAVGDDDQSIYRFQGANIDNILDFKKLYRDPEIITMTDNYRSAQPILDVAREVVVLSDNRLELSLPDFKKELSAKGPNANVPVDEAVNILKYKTFLHECVGIAKKIKEKVKAGQDLNSISVISRDHKSLVKIADVLAKNGIAIRYEKKRNVLEEEHIKMIVTILRYVVTQDDAYLPTILSYPFWQIEREKIWRLSASIKRAENWLEKMLDSQESEIVAVAKFMVDLSVRAQSEPAVRLIDAIVGSHIEIDDDESEDASLSLKEPQNGLVSPFRSYFFSNKAKIENPQRYLGFLSSLRTFVGSVREYAKGNYFSASDVVAFVDIYEKTNIELLDQSPFESSASAVTLHTAHKAKGLEYDTVFVISCTNQTWVGKSRSSSIRLPANLPLIPSGDTFDDKLKLFYVAITRAKRQVYLTYHTNNEDGKDVELLQFLVPEKDGVISNISHQDDHRELSDELGLVIAQNNYSNFEDTEKAFLMNLVSNYKLSVTHLNTFLNVTSDIGGPQKFFENNLIRFPQSQSVNSVFGSAIHSTLTDCYRILKREGVLPSIEQALVIFESVLHIGRLPQNDFARLKAKGETVLKKYLEEHSDRFDSSHLIEVGFSHQDVCLDDVVLSGEIDKIIKDGNEMIVCDYKTGKVPEKGWETSDPYIKIKLHNYFNQLVFYKILIENSRDYNTFKVKKGVIEFLEHSSLQPLVLEALITDQDVARLKALIKAVHTKIALLDFPDVSGYSKTIDGIKKFEDDLISGVV